MVSCKVITVTNGKWSLIISAYLPPSILYHLLDLEEALTCFCDQNSIVLGYLSANIGQAQNPRSQKVYDLLMDLGMMHLLLHFQKIWRFWHMNTWSWVRQGREIHSRSDYILGIDQQFFEMVVIRGIREYPSYNLVLWYGLLIFSTEEGHHFNAGVP